jgi:Protein of unknown function (DUF2782)
MRRALLFALAAAALASAGITRAQQPPKLEPLPEAPPPASDAGADEPQVQIKPQQGERVEEVRDGGRVVMLKVTPAHGTPYYLIDTGPGGWVRRDSLDPGVRVPMWTIKTFD